MANPVKVLGKKILQSCNRGLSHVLGFTLLPGTIHQKFSLPLEYLPSRNYRPRWGYAQPAIKELVKMFENQRKNYDKIFKEMAGLRAFYQNIEKIFSSNPSDAGWMGGAMNPMDLAVLYYFVAKLQPKKYLEIGSGISTFFAARAKKDHQLVSEIVSIDPSPRCEVKKICDRNFLNPLETMDLSIFSKLNPNDIVFMDGSHRAFMNSDVTVFMLDVLPLLKPGVVIHFHDIHLPYDYPEMFAPWYWNEQYLLAVYLIAMGEEKIKILMPTRFMSNSEEVKRNLSSVFQNYLGETAGWQDGGSLWFTKI